MGGIMKKDINREVLGKKWSIAIRDYYLAKKHWHNEMELLFVMKGVTYVNACGKTYEIKENELLYISPGVVHYYEEQAEYNQIFVMRLNEDFMNCLSGESKAYYADLCKNLLYIKKDARIVKIIEKMQTAFDMENVVSIECMLIGLALELSALLLEENGLVIEKVSVNRNNDSAVMDKIITYLQRNMHEKLSLADLAKHIGFSESYCSKYIKKKTNMNFLELINNERIEKAKTELRSTDKPITEIAYLTGFASIQSFNRVFKSYCRVSPSEYRKWLHD